MSLNALPVAYFYLNYHHEIIFANNYAKRLFLKPNLEKNKSIFLSLSNPKVIEYFKEHISFAEDIHDLEIKIPSKDREIYFSLSCYTCYSNHYKKKIIGYTILLFNTTPWRKKYYKENIKHSIESLSTLTAKIAHEIKNPLGSIDLHLQLIERYFKKHKIEDDYLTDITQVLKDEIGRLDKIISDFLLFMRPVNNKKEFTSLNPIVLETLKIMEPVFKDNAIEVNSELDENLPMYSFDKHSIKQVLINLLKNSVEAIRENKNRERKITLKTFTDAHSLFLEIIDTGIGIKKKDINQIFNAYFSTKKMGSGLGLSIIHNIIKNHGGNIDVSSVVGIETQVKLSFHFNPKKILLT